MRHPRTILLIVCVAVSSLVALAGCSAEKSPTFPSERLLGYQFVRTWGDSGSGNGQLDGPQGMAVDASGNVYVADTHNDRIQKFGPLPTPTKATSWGRLKRMFR